MADKVYIYIKKHPLEENSKQPLDAKLQGNVWICRGQSLQVKNPSLICFSVSLPFVSLFLAFGGNSEKGITSLKPTSSGVPMPCMPY